jgi:hypothetical protein
MNNNLLQIKIKQRLNKLASFDYDNIECWQIQEAVNKAQIEWTRRQLYGINSRKEGAEKTSGLVDDLQRLLKFEKLPMVESGIYYQGNIPTDYLHYVRTDVFAKKECCPARRMTTYQVEEANISIILENKDKQPNFDWAETVTTLVSNRLRVYTNGEFDIDDTYLYYFRKPREVQFVNCFDIQNNTTFTADQEMEFNDDVAEVIIDQAVAILAGDIESIIQYQREQTAVQTNS